MERISIILVDDHEDSLDILEFFIQQLPDFNIVAKCNDGEELLENLMKFQVDVILLDINMPKLNGLDAIRKSLKINKDLKFIFITSYSEFAVEAFELSAVDYVVKPIEKTRLYASLEKVRKLTKEQNLNSQLPFKEKLVIKYNGSTYFIPHVDILFIEKIGKKCTIITTAQTYETHENINSIINKLPIDTFFMSHRSYIINLKRISHISQQNQTYLAYFPSTDRYAHVSKLRIDELQKKIISPSIGCH